MSSDPADTVSLPDSTTVREVRGESVNRPPLLPQPGDIWAGVQPGPVPNTPPAAAATDQAPLKPQSGNIWAGILPDQPATASPPPAPQAAQAASPSQAAKAAPPPTPGSAPKPRRDRAAAPPLVQLAATDSRSNAERAWREVTVRNRALMRGHRPVLERAEVNGHTVWRLRANGFSGFAAANEFCSRLVAPGLDCWVVAGSPPS